MINKLRNIYTKKALSQMPRLLGNQDRNQFSQTYGCFHRDYWLDKTSDFPDAVRQFGVHALALVYKYNFPGNIYYRQTKIKEWTIAGLNFWTRIQHRDGSFDEFYPYERGWVGPTAFTLFTSIEAYNLVKDEIPNEVAERILAAIRRAAYFVSKGESEEDHLANHHAMACLAVWKAYKLLGDSYLLTGYKQLWKIFLSYHNNEEGWSREYDGVDPGYLSATISFLSKIYQGNRDPEILNVLRQSVEFCSYFVYPNGFYGGSLGSRNTLHFYPHGFEILAREIPLAATVAEKMLKALSDDKLVPPEIISDRYVFYRVPEYLQAYLDYKPRPNKLQPLPYERETFNIYFPQAHIFILNKQKHYLIANLAKGGVLKIFNKKSGKLLLNDCGLIGKLKSGHVVTSQWLDPNYKFTIDDNGWKVQGQMNIVPSNKVFTLFKNLLFRTVLLLCGWSPYFSHLLKANIRRLLIIKGRRVPINFQRQFQYGNQTFTLKDKIYIDGKERFANLLIGDELFVRYVPQSRYFQSQELEIYGHYLQNQEIHRFNNCRTLEFQQIIDSDKIRISRNFHDTSSRDKN